MTPRLDADGLPLGRPSAITELLALERVLATLIWQLEDSQSVETAALACDAIRLLSNQLYAASNNVRTKVTNNGETWW